jgi:8-oxo-dGTP pyrophosphatase MutT (NUDIX family)
MSKSAVLATPILSAGIIPVFFEGAKPKVLILRAYKNWDFPKGETDPGENPMAAALRELREETGIEHVSFDWGHQFYETEVYGRGKTARYFLARAMSKEVVLGINPELGHPEHAEFRWADFEEARGLMVPRVQKALDWARALLNETKITS